MQECFDEAQEVQRERERILTTMQNVINYCRKRTRIGLLCKFSVALAASRAGDNRTHWISSEWLSTLETGSSVRLTSVHGISCLTVVDWHLKGAGKYLVLHNSPVRYRWPFVAYYDSIVRSPPRNSVNKRDAQPFVRSRQHPTRRGGTASW